MSPWFRATCSAQEELPEDRFGMLRRKMCHGAPCFDRVTSGMRRAAALRSSRLSAGMRRMFPFLRLPKPSGCAWWTRRDRAAAGTPSAACNAGGAALAHRPGGTRPPAAWCRRSVPGATGSVLPAYSRPMVRVVDHLELVERSTSRDDRVRRDGLGMPERRTISPLAGCAPPCPVRRSPPATLSP